MCNISKMFKTTACIFLSMFLLTANADRLFGNRKKDAEKILDRALDLLIHEDGPIYSQHGVDAIYKFVPSILYTFDIRVEDWRHDPKKCTVTISYKYGDINTFVNIKCDQDEEINRIVSQKIFVNPIT